MNRETKAQLVTDLKSRFDASDFLYVVDTSDLNALETSNLRRALHKNGVKMQVAKNTLIRRAMDESERDFGELSDTLKGVTALMFTTDVKAPAKVIKDLRKKGREKPLLKGAYIDTDIFIGDDKLTVLTELKSKDELIAEVVGLLQSPARNVVSALQSSGGKLAGILKTLEEKNN